ncbi:DNA primase [Candidatus Kaiserbacteria bacterium CG10_big_fil_rev_8_21_14_0_10_45_20]|uniref:DNA primase n=1 Tax=Candidatus Kaiserbacteria bacterium CG10_big_fil_rev_8_21_14_0_10_45_20 TaxID=1974607 RepID=A0A2H0UIC8_9BACT|nr:MAG: DNA primase [Candidatus Kaiserbacteria bacterium CG10_big_fil_rev_8_21_14_0_10_45_20]
MNDTVQTIKDKLNIVDVVSPYVKLTKAGKYYRGLSPFNKEKSPSFFVTPDRGLYHCFSSGKGGDMFTFIEEMEGVDFKGALKILADKAGVTVAYEKPENRNRRDKVYALLEDATVLFGTALQKKEDACKYLLARGIKKETAALFRVGYAPNEWRALSDALRHKGYTDEEIEEAGLSKKPEATEGKTEESAKRTYDRFRGRIMFPIRDVSGRVVGFSGRIFEEDPKHPGAKYINSPETPVFNKSRILFGVDIAKEGIRKYGFSILVEGQIDLLMAHQAGYVNAVALSGTSFTEEQATLLARYSPNLVIAFDGDRAGVSAAGRAAEIALKKGLNVKIAPIPAGEDPADIINRDVHVWKDVVKNALHIVDFYLAYLKDLGYDDRRFKLEVSKIVLPYLVAIPNEIDRSHFIHRVAEALETTDDIVLAEVKKIKTNPTPAVSGDREVTVAPVSVFESKGEMVERLLVGLVEALKDADAHALSEEVKSAIESVSAEGRLTEILSTPEEERKSLIEADLFLERHTDTKELKTAIDELVGILKRENAREKYRRNMALLRVAEKEGKKDEVEVLLKAIATLAREI